MFGRSTVTIGVEVTLQGKCILRFQCYEIVLLLVVVGSFLIEIEHQTTNHSCHHERDDKGNMIVLFLLFCLLTGCHWLHRLFYRIGVDNRSHADGFFIINRLFHNGLLDDDLRLLHNGLYVFHNRLGGVILFASQQLWRNLDATSRTAGGFVTNHVSAFRTLENCHIIRIEN